MKIVTPATAKTVREAGPPLTVKLWESALPFAGGRGLSQRRRKGAVIVSVALAFFVLFCLPAIFLIFCRCFFGRGARKLGPLLDIFLFL